MPDDAVSTPHVHDWQYPPAGSGLSVATCGGCAAVEAFPGSAAPEPGHSWDAFGILQRPRIPWLTARQIVRRH